MFTAASLMVWRYAVCSSERFAGTACQNTPARIMIRSIDSTKWQANLRVLEVTEIRRFLTCRCRIRL